jgi:hypothetical protein
MANEVTDLAEPCNPWDEATTEPVDHAAFPDEGEQHQHHQAPPPPARTLREIRERHGLTHDDGMANEVTDLAEPCNPWGSE